VFTLGGGALTFNTINLMPNISLPARIAVSGNMIFSSLAGVTATIAKGSGSGSSGLIDLGGGTRAFSIADGLADVDFSTDVPVINGALIKSGPGTMRLNAVSTYTGGTTVSAGRLLVNTAAGSGTGLGDVTVNGGTLSGTGTIAGAVAILPGGTLSPGTSIGAMTINNSLTLSGVAVMELNAAARTNDLVRELTSVTYGGILTLSNLAGTITPSSAFKLFNANSYSGAFATLVPLNPGPSLAWNTNTLTTDGTLRVVSTTPVTMAKVISSGALTLSWPIDHTGWRLQVQTNSLSIGLSTNWSGVPNSLVTNRMIFTVDPAVGCVFYRLVYP